MRQANLLFIVLLLSAIMGGCSEKAKNPVGFNLWDEEGYWQVYHFTGREILADSSFHVTRGSGIGPYLLVGSWQDQEARSLLSFEENLPDTLDWPLTAVKLILTAYSETIEDSLLISVHALQTVWSDSTATWDYPWTRAGGDYVPETIAQGWYAIAGGVNWELEFDTTGIELVENWLQGQMNIGIILTADSPDGDNLKYFYSEDTPYYPYLALTFAIDETSDTTFNIDSKKDTFIAQPVALPGDDLLLVSDGYVCRTWLQFDISDIPEGSFINTAILSLSVNEFQDPLNNMLIRAYPVSDLETLNYSSSKYGTSNFFSGKVSADFNVTTIVQAWVDGTQNAGFILKTYLEYSSLSQVLFYSSLADSLSRPTLNILYTAQPEGDLIIQKRSQGAL